MKIVAVEANSPHGVWFEDALVGCVVNGQNGAGATLTQEIGKQRRLPIMSMHDVERATIAFALGDDF